MIYGNEQDGNIHMLVKIMNRFPVYPILGKGEGLMHPIYAGDLAKALVSAVLKEEITRNQEYDVAGKTAVLKYSRFIEADRASVGQTSPFSPYPLQAGIISR